MDIDIDIKSNECNNWKRVTITKDCVDVSVLWRWWVMNKSVWRVELRLTLFTFDQKAKRNIFAPYCQMPKIVVIYDNFQVNRRPQALIVWMGKMKLYKHLLLWRRFLRKKTNLSHRKCLCSSVREYRIKANEDESPINLNVSSARRYVRKRNSIAIWTWIHSRLLINFSIYSKRYL